MLSGVACCLSLFDSWCCVFVVVGVVMCCKSLVCDVCRCLWLVVACCMCLVVVCRGMVFVVCYAFWCGGVCC